VLFPRKNSLAIRLRTGLTYSLTFKSYFSGESSIDREAVLMPHLEALADFRQSVRTMAREHKNINILKVLFLIIYTS
jgi:hypothetical protein